MNMPYATYLRVESAAGGVTCTPRAFIRAALNTITPDARHMHKFRAARHQYIRSGLAQLRGQRDFVTINRL